MKAQQAISARQLQAKVGQQIEVIIDTADDEEAVGRSTGDAPEIDGTVLVSGRGLTIGDIVTVVVEQAGPYDLRAKLAI